MKKFLLVAVAVLLMLSMLGGCSKEQAETPAATEPATVPTETTEPAAAEPTPTEATEPASEEPAPTEATEPASEEPAPTEATEPEETTPPETEGEASPDPLEAVYAQPIGRYDTALSEQWEEYMYFDHDMSAMAAYYYEGNALDNVGYTFMDLNGDNVQELLIGAILNAERDPLVFEIWTLQNGEPVMLAQSGSRNRYYLQYAQEDALWSIAYEAENGAANHAVYYLQLSEGKLEVIQGVIFDALANESAPWFMAYDLDWDVSNDTPIDEQTATDVMEAGRNLYTCAAYRPYRLYE